MELIQGSSEWHEWRAKGVGASEVSAILGVCPYNTAMDIWRVKTGRSKGFEGNSFTRHGQETESKARSRYELMTMEDMPPALATHPKYDICRASLDGLRADGKLILEIKCPSGTATILSAVRGLVPEHYKPQVQYQLAVTGADLLHFYVYHAATSQEALVPVVPDVEFQGMIVVKVLDFWERYVVADVPPPLTERDVMEAIDPLSVQLCEEIRANSKTLPKQQLDFLKERVVRLAGHPKVRCNGVQISTVNRNGVFSYHKLTIASGE